MDNAGGPSGPARCQCAPAVGGAVRLRHLGGGDPEYVVWSAARRMAGERCTRRPRLGRSPDHRLEAVG